MIVPMKKIVFLVHHKEKEEFLTSLQKLGVVHIIEDKEKRSEKLEQFSSSVKAIEEVVHGMKKGGPQASQQAHVNVQQIIQQYQACKAGIEKAQQKINALKKERDLLEPWGEFDPDLIKKLKQAGVKIRFFSVAEKKFSSIPNENLTITIVNQLNGLVYFVVVGRELAEQFDKAEEVRVGDKSLSSLSQEIGENEEFIAQQTAVIKQLSQYHRILSSHLENINSELSFESARLNMENMAEGRVLVLRGWLPTASQKQVAQFLSAHAVWYEMTTPTPNDDVPIQLKNNAYTRLFEPVTKIFTLPDYFEFDPTPMLAPFFMLFVGLCMGDLAYGTILFVGSLVAFFKVKESHRSICMLVMILGVSVAVNGILLNSFFGRTLFGGPGIAEGTAWINNGAQYFCPLGPVKTEKGSVFPVMALALVIGFIQISIGMLFFAINRIRMNGMVYALTPIGNILMVYGGVIWATHANFFNLNIAELSISNLKLGAMILLVPVVVGKVFVFTGIALFFLFNDPQISVIKRIFVKGPLDFYFFVSGYIGNILSYLRLFALGLSGGLLGNAFNFLAFMLVTKNGEVNYASPMIIGTVLILIAGHTLNFALSMIGSVVHPLRLTFVEFYGSLSFKGGGKQYRPFKQISNPAKPETFEKGTIAALG